MHDSDAHPFTRFALPIAVLLVLVTAVGGYAWHSRKQSAREIARLEAERVAADNERVAIQVDAARAKTEAIAQQMREDAAAKANSFARDRSRAATPTFSYNYSAAGRVTEADLASAAAATEREQQIAERRAQYEADQALRQARADADRQARWVKQQEQEEERLRLQRSWKR